MFRITLAVISSILTVVFLVFLGAGLFFYEVVGLNGFDDREAGLALGGTLICQVASVILFAIFSGWLTHFTLTKFNWNSVWKGILVVVVAVFAGTLLGGVISFLVTFFSLFFAALIA